MNMSQHTCVGGDVLHPSDQHPLKDGDWVLFGKTFEGAYETISFQEDDVCLLLKPLYGLND